MLVLNNGGGVMRPLPGYSNSYRLSEDWFMLVSFVRVVEEVVRLKQKDP